MAENTCALHKNIEDRLSCVEGNIGRIYGKINEVEKARALGDQKATLILENLSRLPDAIENINKSLILMQVEIENANTKTSNLSTKIDNLENKICTIDSEGKFNIREYIQKHIIQIIIGSAILMGIGALGIHKIAEMFFR